MELAERIPPKKDPESNNTSLSTVNSANIEVVSEKENTSLIPIYLTTHLQTQHRALFFHGSSTKFLYVENQSSKVMDYLGLPFDKLSENVQAISDIYIASLVATESNDNELSTALRKLTEQVSDMFITLNGYRKEFEEQKKTRELNTFSNHNLLKFYIKKGKLQETEIKSLLTKLFNFGIIPETLSFIRTSQSLAQAITTFSESGLSMHEKTSYIQLSSSESFSAQMYMMSLILIYIVNKDYAAHPTEKTTVCDNKTSLMKGFIDLHEYLYKQECMKTYIEVFNLVSAKLEKNSKNIALKNLHTAMWKFLSENSAMIPPFIIFTGYHDFCANLTFLIDKIENSALKNQLNTYINTVNKDKSTTLFQKYELLTSKLYNGLKSMYETVKNLDLQEHPNKWSEFKGILLIILYLNSFANPFGRESLLANAPRQEKILVTARKAFEDWQNDTGKLQVELTDELDRAYRVRLFLTLKTLLNLTAQNNLEPTFASQSFDSLLFEHFSPLPQNFGKAQTKPGLSYKDSAQGQKEDNTKALVVKSQDLTTKNESGPSNPQCGIM